MKKDALVEWVNVVWFTEFCEFYEDADSIVSVFEVLETMDEEVVIIAVSYTHLTLPKIFRV